MLEAGAPGLHLYALNRPTSVRRIYDNLGLAAAGLNDARQLTDRGIALAGEGRLVEALASRSTRRSTGAPTWPTPISVDRRCSPRSAARTRPWPRSTTPCRSTPGRPRRSGPGGDRGRATSKPRSPPTKKRRRSTAPTPATDSISARCCSRWRAGPRHSTPSTKRCNSRPSLAVAHIGRAEALRELGHLDAALAALDRAVTLEADNAHVQARRAAVARRVASPRRGACSRPSARSTTAAARTRRALLARRRPSRDLDRTSEAHVAAETAVTHDPRDADALALLASILGDERRGRRGAARSTSARSHCEPRRGRATTHPRRVAVRGRAASTRPRRRSQAAIELDPSDAAVPRRRRHDLLRGRPVRGGRSPASTRPFALGADRRRPPTGARARRCSPSDGSTRPSPRSTAPSDLDPTSAAAHANRAAALEAAGRLAEAALAADRGDRTAIPITSWHTPSGARSPCASVTPPRRSSRSSPRRDAAARPSARPAGACGRRRVGRGDEAASRARRSRPRSSSIPRRAAGRVSPWAAAEARAIALVATDRAAGGGRRCSNGRARDGDRATGRTTAAFDALARRTAPGAGRTRRGPASRPASRHARHDALPPRGASRPRSARGRVRGHYRDRWMPALARRRRNLRRRATALVRAPGARQRSGVSHRHHHRGRRRRRVPTARRPGRNRRSPSWARELDGLAARQRRQAAASRCRGRRSRRSISRSVPVEPTDHELTLYMEDTGWPHAPLDDYTAFWGEVYAPMLGSLVAVARSRPASRRPTAAGRRPEAILFQKVARATRDCCSCSRPRPARAEAAGHVHARRAAGPRPVGEPAAAHLRLVARCTDRQ